MAQGLAFNTGHYSIGVTAQEAWERSGLRCHWHCNYQPRCGRVHPGLLRQSQIRLDQVQSKVGGRDSARQPCFLLSTCRRRLRLGIGTSSGIPVPTCHKRASRSDRMLGIRSGTVSAAWTTDLRREKGDRHCDTTRDGSATESRKVEECGFTLIELLVVIVILGCPRRYRRSLPSRASPERASGGLQLGRQDRRGGG